MALAECGEVRLHSGDVTTGRAMARLASVWEMEDSLDHQLELLEKELTLNERKYVLLDALDTGSVVMTTLLTQIHNARRLICDLQPVLREFFVERLALQKEVKMLIHRQARRPTKSRSAGLPPSGSDSGIDSDKENLAIPPRRAYRHTKSEGSFTQGSLTVSHKRSPPRYQPYQRRHSDTSPATDRHSVFLGFPTIALRTLGSNREGNDRPLQQDVGACDSGLDSKSEDSDPRVQQDVSTSCDSGVQTHVSSPDPEPRHPCVSGRSHQNNPLELLSQSSLMDMKDLTAHYCETTSDLEYSGSTQPSDQHLEDRHPKDQYTRDNHPPDQEEDAPF